MDGTTLFVMFFGLLGWLAAIALALGWLMQRADSQGRELGNGLNQLNARLVALEQQQTGRS